MGPVIARIARAATSAAVLILLSQMTACSSGVTGVVTPPPPPTTSGTPASISVVTGDGQSAAPGAALPVPVAVIVKDGSGVALTGVVVAFTVDSGGGSLAKTSAVTGSDGLAAAGTWTLGSSSGTNVVSARIGTLTAKLHAQALSATATTVFANTPVAASGGTLTFNKPGDPLNGLTVTVPPSAYQSTVLWTVTADSTIKPVLPADVFQVGPALVIANGQGYADSLVTMTVPMTLAANTAVVPFYYDISSKTLEPIPIVARTATSATLATRHFSGDLMAVRGTSLRAGASLRSGFGSVVIVWVEAPSGSLAGTWNSGFLPGHDDWEFINYGDYIGPDGDCEGMTVTAMYYYYFVGSRSGPSLYHQFDTSLPNPYDNVQGIRLAGSVQGDYNVSWTATNNQIERLRAQAQSHGVNLTDLTATWIALTLKTTHQPVLLSLHGPVGGHAVIAYAAAADPLGGVVVSFADPNFPGKLRTMSFQDGALTAPVQLQINAHSAASVFDEVYAVGVTSNVALTRIQSRWAEFKAGNAGADRIPAHTMEIFDSLNRVWNPLNDGDTVRTTIDVLQLRVRCSGCALPVPGATPADAQTMYIFSDSGRNKLPGDNPAVVLAPGNVQYVGVAMAASPYGDPVGELGFLDSRTFTVAYAPFVISPRILEGEAGTPYTFTASNGGVANASGRFIWTFGDGSDSVVVTGDSTVSHTFVATGALTVSVRLLDAHGTLLGRYSITVTMKNYIVWQITSVQSAVASVGAGVLTGLFDSTVDRNQRNGLAAVQNSPTRTYLFVSDSADCRAAVVEQFAAGDPIVYTLSVQEAKVVVAANCTSNPSLYGGSFHLDSLGHGTLTGTVGDGVLGTAAFSAGTVTIGAGAISAAMSGATLTGTLHWSEDYAGGVGTYTVQFTATQVQPAAGAGLRRQASRGP